MRSSPSQYFAVQPSVTAEDPTMTLEETYLNVMVYADVNEKVRRVFASRFTDPAIFTAPRP